jgi:hypothetical protein
MFATCNEDSLICVAQNLDIISFVQLVFTCKYLYNLRKILIKHIQEYQDYFEYSNGLNILSVLFDSYIGLNQYNDIFQFKEFFYLKHKYDKGCCEQKVKNTINIIGYQGSKETIEFSTHEYSWMLSCMAEKAVCEKYEYTYKKNRYIRISNVFSLNWHICDINVIDICEIVLHLKHRKYKNVMNTINSALFRDNFVLETIHYIVEYTPLKKESRFRFAIICILYKYLDVIYDKIEPDIKKGIQKIVKDIAISNIPVINRIESFPKYLKQFFIKTITDTAAKFD